MIWTGTQIKIWTVTIINVVELGEYLVCHWAGRSEKPGEKFIWLREKWLVPLSGFIYIKNIIKYRFENIFLENAKRNSDFNECVEFF